MREDLERMLERERDSALRVIYQIIFNCVLTVIQRYKCTYPFDYYEIECKMY